MSGRPLWLAAGPACDPARVPDAVRLAMRVAQRVEVAAGASPALVLWARPECVVRLAATDAAPAGAAVVRVAPRPPAAAVAAVWQVAKAEPRASAAGGGLRGVTVVVTRPWPDILSSAPDYAARGGRVVPWPLSTPAPPDDPGALTRAAAAAADGRYAAVGVTSARAAQAWCDAQGANPGPRPPLLAAVGGATAAALAAGGLAPDLVTEGGGEAMGAALGERARGGRVLLVAAAGGRTEAAAAARARGAVVDVVPAYAMVEPPWRPTFDPWVIEALDGAAVRPVYVTWFSPRGVERGMRILGDRLLAAAWVTVGTSTARAARAFGEPRGGVEVARAASAAAVRDAVARLHRAKRRRRAG